MAPLRILQLAGSPQDEFHCQLSRTYVQGGLGAIADPARYNFHTAYVTPDRQWRFPRSLSVEDIAAAKPLPLPEAIAALLARKIDLALPQMFCLPGVTQYRSLLDLLGIPYVGNSAAVMALTAHKHRAKAIVAAAGVKVPYGELLRRGERPALSPPVIIKPTTADNSCGVALVCDGARYEAALEAAFAYSAEVLVEQYIEPGREVRCGTLADGDRLIGLPLEEYPVDATRHPIRSYADKLKPTAAGELALMAKGKTKAWIVDPSDRVTPVVQAAARRCHLALGCRHYGLFDFRIDPQGQPWFLEAGLYCSFSPQSVIPTMARAAGISLEALLAMAVRQVI
ncbi:MAG: D-alanine--D-alanine ligase [Elainellaceae cyanobacterium]